MLRLVISGGQTGADQAAWRAATAADIPTGGWMPKGYLTKAGPRPEFLRIYGAREHESPKYPARTRANAEWADATIWFGDASSPGGQSTLKACNALGREFLPILEGSTRPSHVAGWIRVENIARLNVAGNRESTSPGIGARVEAFLAKVFSITNPA